ncbi:hypothetical protein EIQ06_21575 [Xanthomonas campestris pv. campestris]
MLAHSLPLSPRERGEGTGRSPRVITTARGFARTLIRPCGAPSPDGRRGGACGDSAASGPYPLVVHQ